MFGTSSLRLGRLQIIFWYSFKLVSAKALGITFVCIPHIHVDISIALIFFGVDFNMQLEDSYRKTEE